MSARRPHLDSHGLKSQCKANLKNTSGFCHFLLLFIQTKKVYLSILLAVGWKKGIPSFYFYFYLLIF